MKERVVKKPLTTILSGVSGEYYVAAELSKRGYIASITLRNTNGVDILCSNPQVSKTVSIQVKTNQGFERTWLMNKKVENSHADNLFYVFVNLNDNSKPPDYFIVPSKAVAVHARETHTSWLESPGKNGKSHTDSNMRKFSDSEENYLGRWDILGL